MRVALSRINYVEYLCDRVKQLSGSDRELDIKIYEF